VKKKGKEERHGKIEKRRQLPKPTTPEKEEEKES